MKAIEGSEQPNSMQYWWIWAFAFVATMTLVVHSQSDVTLMTEQKTEWQQEALAVSVARIGLFFRSVSSAGGVILREWLAFRASSPHGRISSREISASD